MTEQFGATPPPEDPAGGAGQPEAVEPESVEPGDAEILEGEILEEDVLDGEVVEPSTTEAAEADALLAEALDAEAIEAEFSAAEADLAAASGPGQDPQVAVLIADLQRVHAEYSDYRKRVERDRDLIRQRAVESTLAGCCRSSTTSVAPGPMRSSSAASAASARPSRPPWPGWG